MPFAQTMRHVLGVLIAALALAAPSASAQELSAEQEGRAACVAAEELHKAKLLTSAHEQYVKAIGLGYCDAARGRLSAIAAAQRRAQEAYRLGLADEEGDRDAEARASYTRAVAIDAEHTLAAKRLDALAQEAGAPEPDRYQKWGDEADDAFDDLADAASYAAFFVTIAALAALALLLVARLPFVRRLGRSFGEISRSRPGKRSTPLLRPWLAIWRPAWYRVRRGARWLWGASVRVEGFKEGEDETLRGAVQGLIGGTAGLGDVGVDLATGEAGSDALDELASAVKDVPHGKVLAAIVPLMRKLLPRDAFFVRVHASAEKGEQRGVAVALATRRNIVRAADVIWEADFDGGHAPADGEDAVPVLAIAAASWADYAMLDHRERLDGVESVRGTRDWRSHALFRVGVEHQRLGRVDTAQALFALAVDADPGNRPARFNLGICDIRRGELEQAVQRFAAIARELDDDEQTDSGGFAAREPLWYQAVYNVAAARWMLHGDDRGQGAERECVREDLRRLMVRLGADRASAAEIAHQRSQRRPAREAARQRVRLLDRIAGPALVLWAESLAAETLTLARAVDVVTEPSDEPVPALNVLPTHNDGPHLAALALRYAAAPPMGPRTAYNLACLFTRIAEHAQSDSEAKEALDWALRHVRDAAEVPGLASWARADPSLAPLRRRRRHEFLVAIAQRTRADVSLPLAALRVVGPEKARALDTLGITSAAALVEHCRFAGGRRDIAAEAGVSEELVERWARLAEIMLALELEPGQANLLDQAQRGTRGALASAPDAARLHELLADLDALAPSGDVVPGAEDLETWIRQLRATPARVFPEERLPALASERAS